MDGVLQNRAIINVFPLLTQQFSPQCFHLRHEIWIQFRFSVGLSLNISLHLKQCSYLKGIKPCLLWRRITSVTEYKSGLYFIMYLLGASFLYVMPCEHLTKIMLLLSILLNARQCSVQ